MKVKKFTEKKEVIRMEKEERFSYEKERSFLIKTAYVATILLLIWIVFHYVVPVIMPFLIAFVIAWMCMPLVQWLAKRTKLKNRKIWGITVIFLLYVSLGSFATWLIFKLTGWIGTIVKKIPDFYYDSVLPALKNALSWSEKWFETFSPELLGQYRSVINDVIKSITNGILSLSGEMASMITSFSLALPNFFITVSFAILASMFIAWDFERITQFFKRQLSDRTLAMLETAKVSFQTSVKDYVKAYVVIALITFTELSIGFYIIGLSNPIGVAASIAIFDMIPVFGTGGIMVPWVLIELLNGDFTLAIQLLIIYGVVTLVRNVIEPKIVGQKLGLNSVLALFVMYVGLKLFGFLGMIAAPILTVMLKNFHDKENLKWWK